MIQVTIDGQPMQASLTGINSMPDLVEFIKANIDPDSIITGMYLGGKPLGDIDWRVPLTVQGDVQLEVTTGSQKNYLADRLQNAGVLVEHIVTEFTIAREAFQAGRSDEGNKILSKAVQDLNAFLQWYNTLMQMLPPNWQTQISTFRSQVEGISKTCEQLLQQQLYHSWWALGETMKRDLEPNLDVLKSSCEQLSSNWDSAN